MQLIILMSYCKIRTFFSNLIFETKKCDDDEMSSLLNDDSDTSEDSDDSYQNINNKNYNFITV